jgi:CubicO group peptidase (beta-lactamase class C family)
VHQLSSVSAVIGATSLLLFSLLASGSLAAAVPKTGLISASPESVGMSSERLQRIEQRMASYIEDGHLAGTVTLVARRGKVVHFEAQGMSDVENGRAMTTDTIFRIASMTKPIASVALMMLYERGLFQLNDPVSKWLPEFADMQVMVDNEAQPDGTPYRLVPANSPITVKQVLTHTAGLMNSYRQGHLELLKNQPALAPGYNLEQSVKRMAALPLAYQPGEKWQYSSATNVVGRLVEVMSAMSLDEFLSREIFTPLKMVDSYFYLPEAKLNRFAAQYRPDTDNGNKIVLQDAATKDSRFVKEPHSYFSAAGGMVATAADYVRFQQMMLNGGVLDGVRLLGKKTVQQIFKNHTGELPIWLRGPGNGFGLGYSVVTDSGAAQTSQSEGSVSWGGAYNTLFWIDPEEQLVAIFMSQLRPYTHLNVRADFISTVNQAIVD